MPSTSIGQDSKSLQRRLDLFIQGLLLLLLVVETTLLMTWHAFSHDSELVGKSLHCDNTSHDSARGRKFLTTPHSRTLLYCRQWQHQNDSAPMHQSVSAEWHLSWQWQNLLLEVANRLNRLEVLSLSRGKDPVACNKRWEGQELGGD